MVWWQSLPQLTSSAYSIPNLNVTLSTEFYVLQSQKVWGVNEHSEIFEMANPFAFKLLDKIETGNGLFYFHVHTLNLPDTIGLGLLNGDFFPIGKRRKG